MYAALCSPFRLALDPAWWYLWFVTMAALLLPWRLKLLSRRLIWVPSSSSRVASPVATYPARSGAYCTRAVVVGSRAACHRFFGLLPFGAASARCKRSVTRRSSL